MCFPLTLDSIRVGKAQFGHLVEMRPMKIFLEFKKFVMRGNLVDLAIGFTVGAAFTTVTKSLVNDIIMPPLWLLSGKADFSGQFIVLREGSNAPAPYITLADAQAAGAVTLNYGTFINNTIALLIVSAAMFLVIHMINKAEDSLESTFPDRSSPKEPFNKKCRYCCSTIDIKASRCPHCTSNLES